jgi:hypothetical protein
MRGRIRRVSAPLEGDRPYYRDIAALEGLIADGELRGCAELPQNQISHR